MEEEKENSVKLYLLLEDISKTEDEEERNNLEKEFRSLFSSIKKPVQLYIPKEDDISQIGKRRVKEVQLQETGNSLLLNALSIQSRERTNKRKTIRKLILFLIVNCPDMILLQSTNTESKGITPLHVAVLKGDKKCLKKMLETLKKTDKMVKKCGIAEGPVFHKTAMMAGTLLGVASLKFDKNMFQVVLEKFPGELDSVNKKDDNILHSLIKYAHVKPDKTEEALKMLKYILDCKFTMKKEDRPKHIDCVSNLLRMKNKEKLTPLQVAAKREQFDFFKSIMQHEVYHSVQTDKGIYTEAEYDITEVETLLISSKDKHATDDEHIKEEHHESVLEYIVHHQTNNAFHFADFLPVRNVIKEKWRYYRWLFWGWFVLHFTFMICLSLTALYRSKLSESTSINDTVKFEYLVTKNITVTVTSVFGFVLGILLIILEISIHVINRFKYRSSLHLVKRVKRSFRTPYSNFMFRVYFVLFSLLLLVDFLIVVARQGSYPDYNNICLIFAVIIGWYLVMFFLQGFKSFSFFTVLIQRVILDMLKFGFVMLIFLVGFSTAMFMIMQGADTEEDDFNTFGKTMVKMLTIMLGIGELEIIFKARQPILAIIVFVVFVCLTTILLLNALIALMSNSCTDLMSSYRGMVATKYHCRLQRLSVILFLESCLPLRFCKEVGLIKKPYTGDQRRFWSLSSVEEYTEEESETSVNTLKNADRIFSLRDFLNKRRKDKKIAPKHTKHEMTQTNTSMQANNKYVDITDMEKHTCKKCNTDNVFVSQTHTVRHSSN